MREGRVTAGSRLFAYFYWERRFVVYVSWRAVALLNLVLAVTRPCILSTNRLLSPCNLVYLYIRYTMASLLERTREWDLDIDRYLNRIIPASPLHKLPTPVSRFLGYRKEQRQDVGNVMGAVWSFVGAFLGLAVVAAVFNNTESIQWHQPPALIASFVSLPLHRVDGVAADWVV